MFNLLSLILADVPKGAKLSNIPKQFGPGQYPNIVHFYHQWAPYLHCNLDIIHRVYGTIANGAVRMLFFISNGFETAFNGVSNLLGWEGTLSASGSPLHGLYMVIYTIGWALLGLSIILVTLQSVVHSVKWSKILPNLLAVSITISVLPLFMHVANNGVAGVGNIAIDAKNDVSSAQMKGVRSSQSLAILPIHDNIVDLARVANHKWDYDPNQLNMAKTNTITTKTDVMNLDLGETMNKESVKNFKGLDKSGDGFPKVQDPFFYKFTDNSVDNNDSSMESSYALTQVKGLPIVNTPLSETYLRYSVNWLGLLGQCIALGVILLLAGIKVVEDIFELSAMQLVAPLLAYKSVHNSKPLRDLASSIVGLYVSIVLMFVVVRMFFLFLTVTPAIANKAVTSPFTRAFVAILIYCGGGYAMFRGVSYFERVCGVSQGFGDEAGNAGAVAAMGAAGTGLGLAAAGHAMNGASSLATRIGGSSQKTASNHGLHKSNNDNKGGNPNLTNQDNGHALNEDTQNNDQQENLKNDQNSNGDINQSDSNQNTNDPNDPNQIDQNNAQNADNGQPLYGDDSGQEMSDGSNSMDNMDDNNPNLNNDNGQPLDSDDVDSDPNLNTDTGEALDNDSTANMDGINDNSLNDNQGIDTEGPTSTNLPKDNPTTNTTTTDESQYSNLSPEQRQANRIADQVEQRLHPQQSRGDKLVNMGHNLRSRGWNSLTSRQFGISQRGHVSGKEAHRFSDD